MPRGRSMPELKVSADERETLERWARRPTTAQALAQRARMILACAEGRPNDQVARVERVTRQTVGRWRARGVRIDDRRPGHTRRSLTSIQKPGAVQWKPRARREPPDRSV